MLHHILMHGTSYGSRNILASKNFKLKYNSDLHLQRGRLRKESLYELRNKIQEVFN